MKIKLTQDEVIKACAEYAQKNTNYSVTEEQIFGSCVFCITDENDNNIIYNQVEFEFVKP